MSDDLAHALRSLAEDVTPPDPDLDAVVKSGRRARLVRRYTLAVVALPLALGSVVLVGQLRLAVDDARQHGRGGIAVGQQPPEIPTSRVATFAVRAIAFAGLLDPTANFNDYLGTTTTRGGWNVAFESTHCGLSTCMPNPEGNTLELRVELRGMELVVAEARGPANKEHHDRLAEYREDASPESPGLEFPSVQLGESADEGVSVLASPLWRGPIPSPIEQVECEVMITNGRGEVIFARTTRESPPADEALRAGTIHIFGAPSDITGEAKDTDVQCE